MSKNSRIIGKNLLFDREQESYKEEQPERMLIAEVIMRAVRDYVNDEITYAPRLKQDAAVWLRIGRQLQEEDQQEPFSFVWCCVWLELNPEEIRDRIVKLSHTTLWLKYRNRVN